MGDTKIAWCSKVWSPVVGCTKRSPGCQNCWAIRTVNRLAGHEGASFQRAYAGLVEHYWRPGSKQKGLDWTGEVRCLPERLDNPYNWRQPQRVFVVPQGDLFHDKVPTAFVRRVFEVMADCRRHTFLVLTKRPERMLHLLAYNGSLRCDSAEHHRLLTMMPLANVWLGCTVEDQKRADERIPLLLQTPAAVRFVSVEPMLGPVDLRRYFHVADAEYPEEGGVTGLDWVIAAGESGPGARPVQADWFRSLRDQCAASGTAFFFKGWGGRTAEAGGHLLDAKEWRQLPDGEGREGGNGS